MYFKGHLSAVCTVWAVASRSISLKGLFPSARPAVHTEALSSGPSFVLWHLDKWRLWHEEQI